MLLTDQKDRPLSIENPEVEISAVFSAPKDIDIDGRVVNRTVQVGKNGIAEISLKVPRSVQRIGITVRHY